jgi:hypothetical protein
MRPGRIVAIVAALAVLGGCAPAVTIDRPADQFPWIMSGPTPTARSIAYALYQDAYAIDLRECPFYLARCVRTYDLRLLPVRIEVDEVRCSPEPGWHDRCSFRLTETKAGHDVVRSRCTGHFEVVGTSHDPMRWGVNYFHLRDESQPAVICRRGRTERRAVS